MEVELKISQLTGFEEHIFQCKYKEQIPRIETKNIASNVATPVDKTLILDCGPITSQEEDQSDLPGDIITCQRLDRLKVHYRAPSGGNLVRYRRKERLIFIDKFGTHYPNHSKS